jgi:hypothetical protein
MEPRPPPPRPCTTALIPPSRPAWSRRNAGTKTIDIGGQNGVDADGKVVGPTVGSRPARRSATSPPSSRAKGQAWPTSCTGPSPWSTARRSTKASPPSSRHGTQPTHRRPSRSTSSPAWPRVPPLGCHRPRVPDRLCFWGILIRAGDWRPWVDVEAILDHQVSDTTPRASGRVDRRRGVHAGPYRSARGVRPDHRPRPGRRGGGRVACTRRPAAGRAPAPTHRPALAGRRWSVAAERHRIPIGWAIGGAQPQRRRPARAHPRCCRPNRPARPRPVSCTSTAATTPVRAGPAICGRPRPVRDPTPRHQVPGVKRQPLRLGRRWIVEATDTSIAGPVAYACLSHRRVRWPKSPPPLARSTRSTSSR